ncbi:MAG: hypothetical protein U1F61_17585 [Opitutaceae bacterium]
MSAPEKPLVYLLLGTPGSGRRAVLADLITDGLAETDRAVTALAATESPDPWDEKLGTRIRWEWKEGTLVVDLPPPTAEGSPPPFTHLFIVADGRHNPVDVMEAFKVWLTGREVELGRILTLVDCQLAHRHDAAMRIWYDGCIHFSDVVLLSNREGVPNKWISDFQTRYKDKFYPALFEFVKQHKVKNPVLVLEPQARRMTQFFDPELDLELARNLAPDAVIEFSGDDEEDEEGMPSPDAGEDAPVDPYLERGRNGRRVIELPDIRPFLPPPA